MIISYTLETVPSRMKSRIEKSLNFAEKINNITMTKDKEYETYFVGFTYNGEEKITQLRYKIKAPYKRSRGFNAYA